MSHSPTPAMNLKALRPPRALVVDDGAANLDLLAAILEGEGYEVTLASSGHLALAAAQARPPDVVLLDIMMPDMDGYSVCRALRGDPATAMTPVLVTTSLTGRAARLAALDAGADDFFSKPLDAAEVLLRARNAVRLKRLQDELSRSLQDIRALEERRDALTQMIVHDLRGPLGALSLGLNVVLAKVGADLSDYVVTGMTRAITTADRLARMTTAILDVAALEVGAFPLTLVPTDVRRLVDEVAREMTSLAESRCVTVRHAGTDNSLCDAELIRRVVGNLLDNALKYTSATGHVTIRTAASADKLRVTVSDDGPGIRPADAVRVFDKFAQGESVVGKRRASSGLGLAFCKLAVEAHHGAIGLDSNTDGGCTFWFEIPNAVAAAADLASGAPRESV